MGLLDPLVLPEFLAKLDSDPDQTYSTGSVKLRSLGNLQAMRRGDKVIITGDVYHTLIDKYDFNDDTSSDRFLWRRYRELAEKGKAKPFHVTGVKPQNVTGVIDLKDGAVQNWKFEWNDTKF